ncbi:MAG: hypothetical protein HY912_14775 [Desulfomonile tiedjei]|uniref:Uncharacterized protein n=1 Tax=Desulfomonile tiedjei TaxID=2358 RepID=A0A9D6Z4P5_9BACT|nr:hypothetical protein [Desulfomonile tiedjei]
MSLKNASLWMDEVPVFHELPSDQAIRKLQQFGYLKSQEPGKTLTRAGMSAKSVIDQLSFWKKKSWAHDGHAFGYIPLLRHDSQKPVQIMHVGAIQPDESLKGARVTIRLNRLRVASYPGRGRHNILFDFHAENHLKGKKENVHFNQVYKVQEGESAGIIGYPIFIGLNVGREGLLFDGCTVNVKNDQDQAIVKFLDSDTFKAGLKLVKTAQPAIAPLTDITVGLTKMLAHRSENLGVQKFSMGLSFDQVPGGARLAEGAYVVVQIPEEDQVVWDWKEWIYEPLLGSIVRKEEPTKLIPFNYVMFGISRYTDSD